MRLPDYAHFFHLTWSDMWDLTPDVIERLDGVLDRLKGVADGT